ncbi:HesA/MoeB/ThiF family protein [Streptomyces sp. NBC_01198]|uniref:HesA/MoeB/ThiF family protein n=1 Tax=Streptomyces sp. NBC_01198 TaxID=2903769 RepID=UPI002E115A2A|nr:ThiF family adenylyltransferase [Streptomyces sp. NBC_01198]
MTELVRLKDVAWERYDDLLLVVHDPSKQIELADPDGHAERMLTALSAGPQSPADLRQRLAADGVDVTLQEVRDALDVLDSLALLRSGDGRTADAVADDGRYRSNLAFFDLFSTRAQPPAATQRDLIDAHVLQLGVGGVGSNVLQHLAGLGVGRLTVLDFDLVEPGNFARQYAFRHQDVGRSKVRRAAEWVREFDPRIRVDAVELRVTGPQDIAPLLTGVSAVSGMIDQPDGVNHWVNEACVAAGVPWVRAGVSGSRLSYFSVDPGRSACYACYRRPADGVTGPEAVAGRLNARAADAMPNTAIGPVAGLLAGYAAFELLRYLTGYEPPHVAGAHFFLDATDHLAPHREAWDADPDCRVCALAPSRGLLAGTAR